MPDHDDQPKQQADFWGQIHGAFDAAQNVHDVPDTVNSSIQTYGLTSGARSANAAGVAASAAERESEALYEQALHAADPHEAAMLGLRINELAKTGPAAKVASENRGVVNAVMETPLLKAGFTGTGAILGGYSMYQGYNEWQSGDKTQGAMDLTAGSLGLGSTALSVLGGTALEGASAVAGPVAVAAGLAAAGNEYTKDHNLLGAAGVGGTGTWGTDAQGKSRDSIEYVRDTTADARDRYSGAVETALGDHWYSRALGQVGGEIAAQDVGAGTTAVALGGDLVGGVLATGSELQQAQQWQDEQELKGATWARNQASAVGGGIASGIGNGARAVGGAVGSKISKLW